MAASNDPGKILKAHPEASRVRVLHAQHGSHFESSVTVPIADVRAWFKSDDENDEIALLLVMDKKSNFEQGEGREALEAIGRSVINQLSGRRTSTRSALPTSVSQLLDGELNVLGCCTVNHDAIVITAALPSSKRPCVSMATGQTILCGFRGKKDPRYFASLTIFPLMPTGLRVPKPKRQ
jgi:hypothetical protein